MGALALSGCTPELDDRLFLVTGPRLLAIAPSPAEAAPPAPVTFRALYVDPGGVRTEGTLSWAYCTARKALTDDGTVSQACLAAAGADLTPIGSGATAGGPLPMDGCRLFGPDLPAPTAGQPSGRPVDPDPTGGFYQPVRLLVRDGGASTAIGAARMACGLGGGPTPDVAADFAQRYRLNEAPALASLSLVRAGHATPIAPDAPGAPPGATVARGEAVTLRAAWAACPTKAVCGDGVCGIDEDATTCKADCAAPKGCTGSEAYLVLDAASRALVTAREAIRVAWFATGGTLGDDSSGRDPSEAGETTLDNGWTAPATGGDVRLWVVIRDDRGGVGWESYRVAVE